MTLTVTDSQGLTDTTTRTVTVTEGAMTLSASGYKSKGIEYVNLSWSNMTTASVDIYRDGTLVMTTPNDGAETDGPLGKLAATFTYKVCEAGTGSCSNTATVVF